MPKQLTVSPKMHEELRALAVLHRRQGVRSKRNIALRTGDALVRRGLAIHVPSPVSYYVGDGAWYQITDAGLAAVQDALRDAYEES